MALDTADAGRARQLRRAGQDVRRARPGGRSRGDIELESETEAAASSRAARSSASARAWPFASIPNSQVKGSGMRMGGGPQQFGVDAEQVPALLAEMSEPASTSLGLPRLRRLAEPERGRSSCEAQAQDGRLALELAERCPARCATQPRRRLRDPLFRPRRAARPRRRSAGNLATLLDERDPRRAARGRVVIELGRYIVGECGRLRRPASSTGRCPAGRRSSSSTAAAPPTRGLRQLRAGDPAELPGRHRQSRRSEPTTTRSRSWAVCAPRSTCSADKCACPEPKSATWSSSSRPVLTADSEPDGLPGTPRAGRGAGLGSPIREEGGWSQCRNAGRGQGNTDRDARDRRPGRDPPADAALLGAVPELDSLAVVEVMTSIEERFGFQIDEESFSGEVFETVGNLAQFVDEHRTD